MQNLPLGRRPAYAIESVDATLRLLQLLRDGGSVRLKDAAVEIGVSPSTAHRLMAMLVYRGFAVQDEAKRYWPGPSLGAGPAGVTWTRELREVAQPSLEALVNRTGETANLMIRVGANVRFITTIESARVLRVTDRRGVVLPARHASGGKALLAELDRPTLDRLFRSAGADVAGDFIESHDYAAFLAELDHAHRSGFATNIEETEGGVGAVGAALHDSTGTAVAAISLAIPVRRLRARPDPGMVDALLGARREIEAALAEHPLGHAESK